MSNRKRVAALEARASARPDPRRFARYRNDPLGYCRDVLRVTLAPGPARILRLLTQPPYRVLAPSAHNVGKSHLAACFVCYRFDCVGGVTLTTAPTDRQVKDILWKEVRKLRARAGLGGFAGPKIPRLEAGPSRWAHGFTARDSAAFQGQHESPMAIVFDEAEGVPEGFWEAAETMRGPEDPMLCIYNPIRTDTQAYVEEQVGGWHVVSLSALDHPNVRAELRGEPAPIPAAIRLARLRDMLNRWSARLAPVETPAPGDVTLAPGEHYRPGPVAESRLLGRRPTRAVNSVWSQFAWDTAAALVLPDTGPLQLGCDVARYGDDMTCWHLRKGGASLSHQCVNGWPVDATAERCKVIVVDAGRRSGVEPREILIAVDDTGVGGGVTDILRRDGWRAVGVNSSSASPNPDYPNLRSALWFDLAEAAASGDVSFARLPQDVLMTLRRQLFAPSYQLDPRGRRVVEPKAVTKARLGRSPDDADALMLSYSAVAQGPDSVGGRIWVPS